MSFRNFLNSRILPNFKYAHTEFQFDIQDFNSDWKTTTTLNSDKSDSLQQRSATLECFLQMLTTMRVPAFFLLQL